MSPLGPFDAEVEGDGAFVLPEASRLTGEERLSMQLEAEMKLRASWQRKWVEERERLLERSRVVSERCDAVFVLLGEALESMRAAKDEYDSLSRVVMGKRGHRRIGL